MTQGNQDPVEWNDIIGSGARKEELARQFWGQQLTAQNRYCGGYVAHWL